MLLATDFERRVVICGSRDYPDRAEVERFVWEELPPDAIVVSGCAPGPDSWALGAARARGLVVEEVPAAWLPGDRLAGFRRNEEMALRAARVVAFWDGSSPGTQHMLWMARQYGRAIDVRGPGAGVALSNPARKGRKKRRGYG